MPARLSVTTCPWCDGPRTTAHYIGGRPACQGCWESRRPPGRPASVPEHKLCQAPDGCTLYAQDLVGELRLCRGHARAAGDGRTNFERDREALAAQAARILAAPAPKRRQDPTETFTYRERAGRRVSYTVVTEAVLNRSRWPT